MILRARVALVLAVALATPVHAGTLDGRLVTFTVETWDDREAPAVCRAGADGGGGSGDRV